MPIQHLLTVEDFCFWGLLTPTFQTKVRASHFRLQPEIRE
jgi:hypothetical protein